MACSVDRAVPISRPGDERLNQPHYSQTQLDDILKHYERFPLDSVDDVHARMGIALSTVETITRYWQSRGMLISTGTLRNPGYRITRNGRLYLDDLNAKKTAPN